MDQEELLKLKRQVENLASELEDLSFSFVKKTGPGSNTIQANEIKSANYIPSTQGWRVDAQGNAEFNDGVFRGAISATTIDIGGSDATSFHVDVNGNLWLGDAAFASAPFKVSNAGALTASSVTITGGTIGGTTTVGVGNVNIAARGWTQTSVFSVTDADTVAWASGTFTSADGTAYSIGGGNTGNMAAATYIYLDVAVSTTAYQVTTTAATAVGAGKVLIAKAQNGTGEATFQVFGGIGGQNINASSIVANSITANELSTSITYAGAIIIDTSGHIRSGQTAFNTGTGWFIGNDGAVAKLSIGNPAGRYLTWDGTDLIINGYAQTSIGSFGGDGSDGALSISSGTTTIDLGSAAVVTKNYTSISITGTGKLAFSNPHANGTIIIIKSQGAVTITSSTNPAIDLRSLGGSGGAGGATQGGGQSSGNSGGGGASAIANGSSVSSSITNGGANGTDGTGYGGWLFGNAETGGVGGVDNVTAAGGTSPIFYAASADRVKSYVLPCSGGGGGAGAGNDGGGIAIGGAGGRGAGALWVECRGALNITSTLNAAGAAGTNGTINGLQQGGGGGGGGGGSIVVLYNTLTANSGTYTVTGGTGGAGGSNSGGDGATGFSLVAMNTQFS